ncbi:hypothetical protein H2200_011916 [Cladophialophora chaetospira]|uniref:AB hydrolase-1 domain-containing protein n=1 Tax=Cladophialophora chaetospira TaxID=386627 RepID=A0AA38WYZ6_9EURO|nr:hypothetical protein H2200_011916 [Cladophialophora chaetospira]
MSTSFHKSIAFRGAKVCYQTYSKSKEALIFIHGWTCDSSLWRAQTPLFQRHCSILIDLPGHGKSDAPDWDYSQELFAESVGHVLKQEGIRKAILIGHSLGGPVSTMVLRLFPDLVAAIIYVDSFFNLPEYYLTNAQRRDFAGKLSDDTKFPAVVRAAIRERATDEQRDEIIRVMEKTPKHVHVSARTTDSLPDPMSKDQVYRIPALHVVTPRFVDFDPDWLIHLPRLETSVWEGHGHFPFMEDAVRFNQEVEAFLSEHQLMQLE